jgi:hypothetical protein
LVEHGGENSLKEILLQRLSKSKLLNGQIMCNWKILFISTAAACSQGKQLPSEAHGESTVAYLKTLIKPSRMKREVAWSKTRRIQGAYGRVVAVTGRSLRM